MHRVADLREQSPYGGNGRGRASTGQEQQGATRLRLVAESGCFVVRRLSGHIVATNPQYVAALTQCEPGSSRRPRCRIAPARVVEFRQRLPESAVQPKDLTPMY